MSGTNGLRPLRTTSPQPLRRRALLVMERAMQWSGAGEAYVRLANAAGAVILMYHSVPSPEAAPWVDPRNATAPARFSEQMRFLASERRVVSMTRLVETLDAGETPPRGTVVLTFDDGYRDNLEVAAPILAELELPATLYLATGYVGRAENQWVDRLYAAFRARTRERLQLAVGPATASWHLDDDETTRHAYSALCGVLLEMRWDERERVLAEVTEQLAPGVAPPRLTLTWDEVRTLRRRFPSFGIGAHTVDHVDLRRLAPDAARAEMRGCADDIERETGERPAHFSFPYGRNSPETRRLAAETGFRTAVADAEERLIAPGADLHGLPRVEPSASPTLFRFHTSGAYPGLPRRLTGRA